ncbi:MULTISPECIES: hypothetical protein [unclassified Prochlorococcus]|nr:MULTISPECIES: hypothetical protein [unclassified Prochlorococcus]KGG26788.1 hypothetical protein EV12_1569 [Prochlorococcus sp. MIT 0701]KGG28250.1 hypothetical protein EV13_1663 [Prochlorococcus sp. MIT 0702]KGG31467.1 hypothetical protein EV14_2259 [Prochlorococcus sp. MIT 0703]
MSLSPGHAGKGMNLTVAPLTEAVGRPLKSCSASLASDLAVLR